MYVFLIKNDGLLKNITNFGIMSAIVLKKELIVYNPVYN